MSGSILLDTRTTSYLDLIGNGKVFTVPPFQRDYSWTEEQWEDLWNDLLELWASPDERHYMGALVVESSSDRRFTIIDGQQRLATLGVLALAVIDRLCAMEADGADAAHNRERADALRMRFVGEKDPASLMEFSKLELNDTDKGFYQDYLVQLRQPGNPRGLVHSNRLLWECFCYFRTQLAKHPEFARDGEALAGFLSRTAGRQLLFILITVDDELKAYSVFETLNARGLELTATDLLKNYLFSRVQTRSDLESLQRRWRVLVGTVRQERFPEFLRYHLLCEYPKIRSPRLFKLVRDRYRSAAEVMALVEALESRSELFAALNDAGHEYWVDRREALPQVKTLLLFGVRQATPLLFAAFERLDAERFVSVLRLVSVIIFRYTVVGRLNPSAYEAAFHSAAKSVLEGRATTAAHLVAELASVNVDDDKFREDFSGLTLDCRGKSKKLAKYILCALESDATQRALDAETDPATIEHVLPTSAGEDWGSSFDAKRAEALVDRLGNLALLSAVSNRRLGDAGFGEKREVYAVSEYRLTKQIADEGHEEWSPELIERRQRQMAARAVHIWRFGATQ